MKRITKVKKENVKHFDFAKKAKTPCWLYPFVTTCLCNPILKSRGFTLKENNMESLAKDEPYLLFPNHCSFVDFMIMLSVTHPSRPNNVMSLEGFNTYTEPLMRSLGVCGTRKYISDMHIIKNIRYCLHTLKNPFVMFPEARYSLEGCTSFIPDSCAKLVKMMKVPVVVLQIHGNFVTCPQWNKVGKYGHVEAEITQIITKEEVGKLSLDEIDKRIREHFVYDDYKWQLENKIVHDHPRRADGLHCLLYKCPNCGTEHEMDSKGIKLWCNHCKKEWEQDEYGQLHALEGETEFSHIPDWSNWERECVRKEVEDGTYYFEDTVRVETLPGSLRFYHQGEGTLIQTPEGTRVICNYHGEPFELFRSGIHLNSMHIEYDYLGRGDCVDISIPDDSFWCYVSKRDVITKIAFATEEIHKLAVRKAEEQK